MRVEMLWIPAFAGITEEEAGITEEEAGMTEESMRRA